MSALDEANDFLNAQGGRSAFPDGTGIGAKVTGKIIAAKKQQQTDINGNPRFFESGDPMMLLVVDLQTAGHDDDEDDGVRRLYVKGGKYEAAEGEGQSMLDAIRDAVKKADAKLDIGGELTVLKSGIGKKKAGQSAPWLYKAKYVASAAPVPDIDDF